MKTNSIIEIDNVRYDFRIEGNELRLFKHNENLTPSPILVKDKSFDIIKKISDTALSMSIPVGIIVLSVDLVNLPTIIFQFLAKIFSLFGIFKKGNKTGFVYNSKTKEPVSNVIIRLFKEGKLVATTVSDARGAYYFDLDEGSYTLEARKFGYRFPSKLFINEDFVWGKLYKGGNIDVIKKDLLSISIPLDPSEWVINLLNLRRSIAYGIGVALLFLWRVVVLVGLFSSAFLVLSNLTVGNALSLFWYLFVIVMFYFNRVGDNWKYGKITHNGTPLSDVAVVAKNISV
ncbi:MAG TPA: carboxypeptidase-like regulatory domain-containing protein [Candidatus Dojkabacteria bacterium]|nr:carboxypeptidase-like regulatory domain-containing protein [Candidatus Dojkabacteria bacterium]HQF36411.1 carboxypeptidase-like regulatory domain-containing protein [Candidatus Dojkabacteria bacterium]